MKKSKLLLTLFTASIIAIGCSSQEEKQEEVKQEQTKNKEILDISNLKKENRRHPEFKYVTTSILKLNNSNWSELKDEKIYNFITQWIEKRDSYHDKTLLIYNEDTKKGILAIGTNEIINYKPYNVDVPVNQMFELENPAETMFVWNDKEKTYHHIETKDKLDLTK